MHCLSIWNTFPVYQSGKTDVIKTINCYYVSKNNWNSRMLCIREQVDCKIKGRLHIIRLIQLSLSIISHFIAVPTLWRVLWIIALPYQPWVYTTTHKTSFWCITLSVMSKIGMLKGVIISFTPWQKASEGLYNQLLQLVTGPVRGHCKTFQNVSGLWVQPWN